MITPDELRNAEEILFNAEQTARLALMDAAYHIEQQQVQYQWLKDRYVALRKRLEGNGKFVDGDEEGPESPQGEAQ